MWWRTSGVGLGMTGGWEGDSWSGECWEGVLRVRKVLTFPPWQWEWRMAVVPLLLRWRKVSMSRERWALSMVEGWWEVTREVTSLQTSWLIYFDMYFSNSSGHLTFY